MGNDGPCIVTGQQIGLLGGPLYTPYKVLGAAALARELGGRAVYWLETHDADFEEISSIPFIDASGGLKTLKWEKRTGGETSGSIGVDAPLRSVLSRYFEELPQTESTPALKALALDCYAEGRSLGDASEALARKLFEGMNLEFFRPDRPEFRAFCKPFLLHEAECAETGAQVNAFLCDTRSGRPIRRAFFKGESGFVTREKEKVDPAKFDLLPNVKTRSIIQDAYFKAHTYVAGPGEVAYLKDLGPQYARHKVAPAQVRPRMSALILDHRDKRLLARAGLTHEQVVATSRAELLKKTLAAAAHFDFDGAEKKLRQVKESAIASIAALGLDATPVERPLYDGIRDALGRRRAAEKKRHEDVLRAAMELSDRLHPGDVPQERVFTIFDYMNRHGGLAFMGQLAARHRFEKTVLEFP